MTEPVEMPMPDNLPEETVRRLLREPQHLKLVIIESPYAGAVEQNLRYARAAMHDSLQRGEAPLASHLLYTQYGILNDLVPEEREWGINAGLAWARKAQLVAFYIDLGYSRGMQAALDAHQRFGIPHEERRLPNLKEIIHG